MPRVTILATTLLALFASPASAAINATSDPRALADSMVAAGTTVTGAGFDQPVPTGSTPVAVADSAFGGFPLDGTTFGILTSGDATVAANPQSEFAGNSTGATPDPNRGPKAQDVTVHRVDLDAPQGTNCLVISFRFLSEEYPSFVGSDKNDGFIAELDRSTWTTDASSNISAPDNFAFDQNQQVISVNSMPTEAGGGASPSVTAEAAGTIYDGATPKLSASTATAPGAHSLYLSIFDQGDSNFDSAVFVDTISFLNAAPGGCVAGAQTSPPPPAPPPPPPAPPQQAILGQTVVPEPVQGQIVRAGVISGKIRIKRRGSSSFEELDGIEGLPVGSTIDATQGRMRLTTATGIAGVTQTADFYKGEFQVLQSKNSATTELKLSGDSLASCSSKRVRSSAKRKPVRRLFGDGKGSFRTRGRHAAATVRGTKWLTQDTCKGTLVKVSRGTVKVRDFTRKRTVTVRQGHSYLARPPR